MMRGKKWSKNEIELIEMFFPKASKGSIMDVLPGRSWRAICIKADSLDVLRTIRERGSVSYPTDDAMVEKVRSVYMHEGLSIREVAEACGVSKSFAKRVIDNIFKK